MNERGIPEIGGRPRNRDFITVGKAFGCHTARPTSLMDLETSLKSAFTADRPTLIELREDAAILGG